MTASHPNTKRPALYKATMSETEKILRYCHECGVCCEQCEFLKQTGGTPKKLAEGFQAGDFHHTPHVPYSCNLCDLCEELCPERLNIGRMCLEARRQLIQNGIAPLPPHIYIKRELEWVTSDSFSLSLPHPSATTCERVFFPGCSLSGYSPSLVIKVYNYLLERLPNTGIILGCCGAPARELGDQSAFNQMLHKLKSTMRTMEVLEIILACPNCYYNLRQYASEFHSTSLYQAIMEVGLPHGTTQRRWTFSLHDPCKARWEQSLQQSVRALIRKMGYTIEEMEYSQHKTRCCGSGGTVFYVDFDLSKRIVRKRTEEASFDLLTYCSTCRETLAREKPTLHVLDLIFNPNWTKDRLRPPHKASTRRQNQALLKSLLANKRENLSLP